MSQDPAFLINHELRSKGFASLGEAGALISQLAFCVRDDYHFRALLIACEPEHRRDMYEVLAPNMSFKARPLADYLIEAAQDAERRQLPTVGPDGQFQAFKVPELVSDVTSDDAAATAAVADSMATEHLCVVCTLCTREAVFDGVTREDAVHALRRDGWRWALKMPRDGGEGERVEVCPACVKRRAPRRRSLAIQ